MNREKLYIPEPEIESPTTPQNAEPVETVESGHELQAERREFDQTEIEKTRETIEKLGGGEEQKPTDAPPTLTKSTSVTETERVKPAGMLQAVMRDRMDVIATNARHILGEQASDQDVANLTRQTFTEWLSAIRRQIREGLTPGALDKNLANTTMLGREHIDAVLEQYGKGVVVTSHMVYFPTAMNMIPRFIPENTRGTVLVEKNPLWPIVSAIKKISGAFRPKKEATKPWEIIPKESKNPRTLLSVLHRLQRGKPDAQRELFFMAADRGDLSPDGRRTMVDFFDSKVNFPTGPVTIARSTGAPIIPSYILRQGDGFEIRVGEPIEVDKTRPAEEVDQEVMQRVADFFATGIREKPEQWPVYRHDYWPEQKDFKPAS